MKKLFLIFITLITPNVGLTDNLTNADYVGEWKSNWVAVEGAQQRLIISSDKSSIFEIKYEENVQQYKSKSIEIIDDLLVIKYSFNEGNNLYKLVLSGWRIGTSKRLYGTMYIYKNGDNFNGLPVSFAIEK